MDLERLKEYEAGEAVQFDAFIKRLGEGESGPYPSPERFRRLTQPVAKRAQDGSIWPQIPTYGSLMIPLFPVREADFFGAHQFEVADLPRLVDLCRETGRVQFVLSARPTQFTGLDYLDPVLSELRPPVVRTIPNTAVFDEPSLKKTNLQFDTMASISLWPLIRASLLNSGLDYRYADQTYNTLRDAYAMLKLLGYSRAIAEVDESVVADPPRAHRLLYFYNQFVQGPMFDPLKGIFCFSRDYIKEMKKMSGSSTDLQNEGFPSEVGAFLLNSLVLAPESMDACLGVIDRYEAQGVTKLAADLGSAGTNSRLDEMNSVSAQLSAAFQNVWEDAKGGTMAGVSHGISLELAAGGYAAGLLLNGSPEGAGRKGLLSALGFQLNDRSVESASEETKSAKAISRSYTMSVYNFRKKHRFEKS